LSLATAALTAGGDRRRFEGLPIPRLVEPG